MYKRIYYHIIPLLGLALAALVVLEPRLPASPCISWAEGVLALALLASLLLWHRSRRAEAGKRDGE